MAAQLLEMCLSKNFVVCFPCLDQSEAIRGSAAPVPESERGTKTLAVTQFPGAHTDGIFGTGLLAFATVADQRRFSHA